MDFLLYLAVIPFLGLAAQWIAWKTNLPGILLLLLFGVLLGQWVKPDQYLAELTGGSETAGPAILFPIVSLAVAIVMFEGGLSLKLSELKEAGGAALRLCTIGAVVTWAGATLAAHYCLSFSWSISFLLGAILVVTGPTVIGPLLRQVRPSRRVSATLKWEGIVIDPIGAVLAVLVFENVLMDQEHATLSSAAMMLIHTSLVGTLIGAVGGFSLTQAFKRFLVPDHLHGVCALSIGLLMFAIANHFAHESGLIAVTVLGMWLTNQHEFAIEHIIEFKENLRTLVIGCMFIVLGSRIDLADVAAVGWPGVVFLLALILIVRPVSVFLSLIGSNLTWSERLFVAGLAPRGIVAAAVSSVFALELESRMGGIQLAGADQLSTVTFLVIVGTVAVYGLTASPLAKWLHLADEKTNGLLIAGADPWVREFALHLQKLDIPVVLVDTNYAKISQAKIDGLDAVCMNILNEMTLTELPLRGIGSFLAMTPNDEVNSMAVRECREIFGRASVYQMTFNSEKERIRRGMAPDLKGRGLFGQEMTFTKMREQTQLGATFKTTTLTEEYGYEDFLDRYRSGADVLCIADDEGSIKLNTVKDPLKPTAGDKIVALVAAVAVPDEHESQA